MVPVRCRSRASLPVFCAVTTEGQEGGVPGSPVPTGACGWPPSERDPDLVAFRWIGIGAVYAIALGTPLVLLVMLGWFLARGMRRRREEALLSRA